MSKIYIPVAIQRAVLELSRDYCEYCVVPSNFSTDYFQWSNDDLYIVGLTAIGRATIDLLKLNRTNALNLRKLLKMGGLHPPPFSIKKDK